VARGEAHVAETLVSVSEMVGFLADHRPEILTELRSRFPSADLLLLPGAQLGIDEQQLAEELMAARVATSVATLLEMKTVAATMLTTRRGQLAHARRSVFIAQWLTILGSSGVIGTKLGQAPEWTQYVAAIVTLFAGSFALWAEYQAGEAAPGNNSAQERYWRLVGYQSDVEHLLPQLEVIAERMAYNSEKARSLIERSETLCRNLRDAEAWPG